MEKIILSNEEIVSICKDLAAKLKEKFANSNQCPIFLGVLKGE